MGIIPAMTEMWRDRLAQAIERSGRSLRSISKAVGKADGYLYGVLHEGKEPGINTMARLADELNVSLAYLVYGVEMSGNSEKLLRLFAELNDEQQADFLRLAESVSAVAKPKT